MNIRINLTIGGIKTLANNPPSNRNFFRVYANVPLISFLVPHEEKDNIFSEILDKGSVPALNKAPLKKVDISGGGLSFETPEHYVIGDIVEINMILDKILEGVLVIYGEVVRVQPVGRLFNVAVKFTALDDRIRDVIIRFVFMRERELIAERKAGWL